jgi:Spy/CpxP family protein refolding chaperone
MRMIRIFMIAATLTLAGSIAFAQQAPRGGSYQDEMGLDTQPGQWNPPSKEKREEVRKRVEAIRIYRLTGALKLDEKSSAQLASLLGAIDLQRRQLMEQNMDAMKELRSSLKSPHPSETKLNPILERLEKNHREMSELKDKELKGLKDILTVEQRARYIVFQRDFTREIRSLITSSRGEGQGMHGGSNSGQAVREPGMGAGQTPQNR